MFALDAGFYLTASSQLKFQDVSRYYLLDLLLGMLNFVLVPGIFCSASGYSHHMTQLDQSVGSSSGVPRHLFNANSLPASPKKNSIPHRRSLIR
jgi:hypothetical protein